MVFHAPCTVPLSGRLDAGEKNGQLVAAARRRGGNAATRQRGSTAAAPRRGLAGRRLPRGTNRGPRRCGGCHASTTGSRDAEQNTLAGSWEGTPRAWPSITSAAGSPARLRCAQRGQVRSAHGPPHSPRSPAVRVLPPARQGRPAPVHPRACGTLNGMSFGSSDTTRWRGGRIPCCCVIAHASREEHCAGLCARSGQRGVEDDGEMLRAPCVPAPRGVARPGHQGERGSSTAPPCTGLSGRPAGRPVWVSLLA